MNEIDLSTLDPGIRRTVAWLRSEGFNTTDSGDGQTKGPDVECALPFAHVVMLVPPDRLVDEARRLKALILAHWIDVAPNGRGDGEAAEIDARYDPVDDSAVIILSSIRDSDLPSCEGM